LADQVNATPKLVEMVFG